VTTAVPVRPGVQVFGRRDSRETQRALRFFKERRVPIHLVDVAAKPPSAGELRRFSQRLGTAALLDRDGRRYHDLGLAHYRLDERELFERLLEDPALLRLPLVRYGDLISVGAEETIWRAWLQPSRPQEVQR
jgi:arsenate reductase